MRHVLALVLALSAAPAMAETITGTASVIDGDTLEIRGGRIRMQGIDAPESRQLCEKGGKRYLCGKDAANALADKIGRQTVSCATEETDKYGRAVAVCRAGGADLNQWMVAQGYALAYRKYSTAYAPDEDAARAAKRGIWAGTFEDPEQWRHRTRGGREKTAAKTKRSRGSWRGFRKPVWVSGHYRSDGRYVRGHFRWR